MINLDELLFTAYTRGATDKSVLLTKDELRSMLLSNVPLLGKVQKPTEKSDSEESDTEKPAKKILKKTEKPKTASGDKKPRKARTTAGDEVRCHARTFNEKEHLENGKPKVINPDDDNNLYGGRCSAKKDGESDFCKMHAEKQAHGVWDGAYGDKLKKHLEAPEKETKPKKTTDDTTTKKKIIKKAPKVDTDNEDDIEEHEDDEYISSVNQLEENKVEYDWLEIDHEDYMIDAEGNVYDPESEQKIGKYNIKTKKWISGGPTVDEE